LIFGGAPLWGQKEDDYHTGFNLRVFPVHAEMLADLWRARGFVLFLSTLLLIL
jgi:hypothetical protein